MTEFLRLVCGNLARRWMEGTRWLTDRCGTETPISEWRRAAWGPTKDDDDTKSDARVAGVPGSERWDLPRPITR